MVLTCRPSTSLSEDPRNPQAPGPPRVPELQVKLPKFPFAFAETVWKVTEEELKKSEIDTGNYVGGYEGVNKYKYGIYMEYK